MCDLGQMYLYGCGPHTFQFVSRAPILASSSSGAIGLGAPELESAPPDAGQGSGEEWWIYRSEEEARKWLTRAACKGHAFAQYLLGTLLEAWEAKENAKTKTFASVDKKGGAQAEASSSASSIIAKEQEAGAIRKKEALGGLGGEAVGKRPREAAKSGRSGAYWLRMAAGSGEERKERVEAGEGVDEGHIGEMSDIGTDERMPGFLADWALSSPENLPARGLALLALSNRSEERGDWAQALLEAEQALQELLVVEGQAEKERKGQNHPFGLFSHGTPAEAVEACSEGSDGGSNLKGDPSEATANSAWACWRIATLLALYGEDQQQTETLANM